MIQQDILLAMIPAFLGVIDHHIRAIAYDYTEDTISIYIYTSTVPTEEDYETIDIAVTEIMASLPQLLYQHIEIVQHTAPIRELNCYKGWFFVRKE
ncbi:hypothetical protein [Myroides odoratimimus]|uniref:hypothetical protein n=1 Tax=Myroides odoratimimus TaxID=76832 RepID=UPI00091153C7|nr:hypothetical protein [Myroides odoratimimus]SHL73577.1 hypothetical protein SAMN05444275_10684 [Myroides odoratimimus subsp. xuanwuensis]